MEEFRLIRKQVPFLLHCYISDTMVYLRRLLSLLIPVFCCCLLNYVGLIHPSIHSFILVQESRVFDVVFRLKKRTGGNLPLCLYPTCYALHSEQKQVQRLKIDNLIELLSIAYP